MNDNDYNFSMMFPYLNDKQNKILEMYITGRQFINSIPEDYYYTREHERISLSVPYVVTKIFSIEIFIKLIYLFYEENYPRGHCIYDLFEQIKQKSDIYEFLKLKCDKIFDNANQLDIFIVELKKHNNAFIEWRYNFEKEHILSCNLIFINYFSAFLEEYCRKIISEKLKINIKDFNF